MRACTVQIPCTQGGHYEHRVEASSSLDAASKALAKHEEYARTGKLSKPNPLRPSDTIVVYAEGAANGTSFRAGDPQHHEYRYTVARVREWRSLGTRSWGQ
jgi:hypothetical protein